MEMKEKTPNNTEVGNSSEQEPVVTSFITENGSKYNYMPNGEIQRTRQQTSALRGMRQVEQGSYDTCVFIPSYESLKNSSATFEVQKMFGANEKEYRETVLKYLQQPSFKGKIIDENGKELNNDREIKDTESDAFIDLSPNLKLPVAKKANINYQPFAIDHTNKKWHMGGKITGINDSIYAETHKINYVNVGNGSIGIEVNKRGSSLKLEWLFTGQKNKDGLSFVKTWFRTEDGNIFHLNNFGQIIDSLDSVKQNKVSIKDLNIEELKKLKLTIGQPFSYHGENVTTRITEIVPATSVEEKTNITVSKNTTIREEFGKRVQPIAKRENKTQETEAIVDKEWDSIDTVITAKGSSYKYLPDGRTQRFKKVENKDYEPQDALVYIPNYKWLKENELTKLEEAFGKKFDGELGYEQFLLRYVHTEVLNMFIFDKNNHKLETNKEIAGARARGDRIRLALGTEKKIHFAIPVSHLPKLGFSTYSTKKSYNEKEKQEKRQKHIGNEVVEIIKKQSN